MSISTTSGLVARAAATASQPVAGLGHDLHLARCLEHGTEARSHQRLVVGDQQADLGHRLTAPAAMAWTR